MRGCIRLNCISLSSIPSSMVAINGYQLAKILSRLSNVQVIPIQFTQDSNDSHSSTH